MTIIRSRASAILAVLALLVVATMWTAPAPAEAATCVSVPGGTPGTDVSILGQNHRIPAVSGVRVCVGGATAPLVTVDSSPGGACAALCFSVFVLGGPVDSEGVSVSYSLDGSPRTTEVDPGGAGGGGVCVVSAGSPDAEYPGCAVAIGPEIGDPVGDVQAFLDETFAPVREICDNNPDLCSGDPQAIRDLVNAIKCFVVPTAPGCPAQ